WDLDGTTSTAANPQSTYSAPGLYDIRLIVTDGAGCKDTLVQNSYVQIATVDANFQVVTPICKGAPITLTNNTVGASNFVWNWGDNTTGTGMNPYKTYA